MTDSQTEKAKLSKGRPGWECNAAVRAGYGGNKGDGLGEHQNRSLMFSAVLLEDKVTGITGRHWNLSFPETGNPCQVQWITVISLNGMDNKTAAAQSGLQSFWRLGKRDPESAKIPGAKIL